MKKKLNFKQKLKRWLADSICLFGIFFLLFSVLLLYQSYKYYSVYDLEDLKTFFSWKNEIVFQMRRAALFSFINIIIYQPAFWFLDFLKINNTYKVIFGLFFVCFMNLIIFFSNFILVF